MHSMGQPLEDGAIIVDTREGDVVTAPVDLNALSLQGEEDGQCGNSGTAVEGSGGDTGSVSTQDSQSGVGRLTSCTWTTSPSNVS